MNHPVIHLSGGINIACSGDIHLYLNRDHIKFSLKAGPRWFKQLRNNLKTDETLSILSFGCSPKVNKTVQLRLQILEFWLFPHTDENGVILLPHAYRMWNKNSFNKIVIDFILWCVKIRTIFRNFMPCNICYVGQGDWFTLTFICFVCLINRYVVQTCRIDICLERKDRNLILR